MRMKSINLLRAGGVAVLGLLAGCGYFSGSKSAAAAHAPPPEALAVPAADPYAKMLAGMVDAVGPSRSQAPVNLKFSLRDRPQVGADDEIDYAVIPGVPGLQTIRVAFASFEGLQVIDRGPALAAIKPAPGVPILGSITVRPLKAGVFTLTAAVAVESQGESVVWPFSIPVIAGDGPAQTAASQP